MEEARPQSGQLKIQTSKKFPWKKVVLVLLAAVLIGAGAIAALAWKTTYLDAYLPTSVKEFFGRGEVSAPSDEPVAPAMSPGKITGSLTYPSEMIPPLTICAVDSKSKQETCTETELNATKYELEVAVGSYFVYAQYQGTEFTLTAYYTKCDSSLKEAICTGEDWNEEGFVCYEDPDCKKAFTPAKVTVEAGQTAPNIKFEQGWYLPCSEEECASDSAEWEHYLVWD